MKTLILCLLVAGSSSISVAYAMDENSLFVSSTIVKVPYLKVSGISFSDGDDKFAELYWDKDNRLKLRGDPDVAVKQLFDYVTKHFNSVIEENCVCEKR